MKKTLSLVLAILITAALCVSFASCGGSSGSLKDKLVGTWKTSVNGFEVEYTFEKDGTAKMSAMGVSVEGAWKVVDEKTIEVSGDAFGGEASEMTVEFAGNEMALTDDYGEGMVFRKK